MLKWLFGGGTPAAEREPDHVWISDAARLAGVVRAATARAQTGGSSVVVALTPPVLDQLATRLEPQRPLRCADAFSQPALMAGLSRAGSVAVALDRALPTAAIARPPQVPVHVLVVGRHDVRPADEAIVRFADAIGPPAQVTFHLSLDDPLIRDLGDRIGTLLERLGMTPDEPITHAMVTRAIEKAQRSRAG